MSRAVGFKFFTKLLYMSLGSVAWSLFRVQIPPQLNQLRGIPQLLSWRETPWQD
jgi:hypothetical protein